MAVETGKESTRRDESGDSRVEREDRECKGEVGECAGKF